MKRKFVLTGFIVLCLCAFFFLPFLIEGVKLTKGQKQKSYTTEQTITPVKAAKLFPSLAPQISHDGEYTIRYTLRRTFYQRWLIMRSRVDTLHTDLIRRS